MSEANETTNPWQVAAAETESGEAHGAKDAHGTEAYDAHGGEHGYGEDHHEEYDQYLMPHEIPNIATLMEAATTKMVPHHGARPHPHFYIWGIIPINPLFTILYCAIVIWFVRKAMSQASLRNPGKLQTTVEVVLGGLRKFFIGIMGEHGPAHAPLLVTMWLFIWFNNVMVLVPGMKSPSMSFKTTIACAICVFVYARYQNIKALGFGGYLHHLAGSPRDPIMWALSPLFFFLELLGEVIKPVSLALRLFGNIFGEDKLLASFLGMGMMLVAVLAGTPTPPIGIPLHLPFFFLVVLLGTIQATVFTLLAAIYLVLMMPHDHGHEHDEAHGEDLAATVEQPKPVAS